MTYAITFAAEQRLQFRFKPGDKFSLVSVNEQKASRAAPILGPESRDASRSEPAKMGAADANEESMEQTMRLECDFDIEEVEDDGCAWARYTYRRVAMTAKGAGVDMEYDSDAPPITGRGSKMPPQVLPFYLALGESFFVRITPQGRITNVNGLSAVVGNAKSKLPNVVIKDQLIQVIDRQFDEAAIKRGLQSQLAVFPPVSPDERASRGGDANAGAIGIGDTWSRRQGSDEDKVSLERIFRLKQVRDGIAVVDVNIVVNSDASAGLVFIGERKAMREVSNRGTGQIEIEESTGRIINSTLTQDVVEKITFLPEGAMRRPPPAPAPTRTHIVTTFQMIRRNE